MLRKDKNYKITATKITRKQYKKEIHQIPTNQIINFTGHDNMPNKKNRINIALENNDIMYVLQNYSNRNCHGKPEKQTITKFTIQSKEKGDQKNT